MLACQRLYVQIPAEAPACIVAGINVKDPHMHPADRASDNLFQGVLPVAVLVVVAVADAP